MSQRPVENTRSYDPRSNLPLSPSSSLSSLSSLCPYLMNAVILRAHLHYLMTWTTGMRHQIVRRQTAAQPVRPTPKEPPHLSARRNAAFKLNKVIQTLQNNGWGISAFIEAWKDSRYTAKNRRYRTTKCT
ncbi:hypothetical protein ACJ73_07172, partial [Blastomyces percursus]